jgi:hypothetical protein
MITLLIKGDMVAAALAASAHGVKLHRITTHDAFRECIADADVSALGKVIAWFCEPGEAPFPDGALTFYSQGRR